MKYYTLDRILETNADYHIIIGERSNGKTYAALKYGLTRYIETGEQFAYIRRWREDIRGKRGAALFGAIEAQELETLTAGKYNNIILYNGRFYLAKVNPETKKRVTDPNPCCFIFALSEQEHDKAASYPGVTSIIFDEFITRRYYLPDEFLLFMNLCSTIIRQRDNVKIFMIGNTVNKYSPYFNELGLTHIKSQQQGTIDIYRYGEGGAVVAVEYAAHGNEEKPSNKYFAFNNEGLKMITGGKWELAVYPHLIAKYKPREVVFYFYILFEGDYLRGDIVETGQENYIYIFHTEEPSEDEKARALIYTLTPEPKATQKRRLISAQTEFDKHITAYFAGDRVYYEDNGAGEIVRNYIKTSTLSNILNL